MPPSIDVFALLMGLLGGLALFLFGMEEMTQSLRTAAGGGMKRLLARLTTNRIKAAVAGATVTAVIQSSSITTVLAVGFVSAGLMTLTQSIGVIMGANVGTTVTAQIIAFKVTDYALALVAVGFALSFVVRRERIRQFGTMLLGLGLIFLGMHLMSDATRPLRSYEPFIALMRQMNDPLPAIALSAAFTALIQSSSATTGVIIVLAGQGFVTLEAGIALAFGANVGTCVTALLAAVGKPREALQAALVHVVFNVAGVLAWLAFIDDLAVLVRAVTPGASGLTGVERLAADAPRQIANAHTIFNVANTLVFLPFSGALAWVIRHVLPTRPLPYAAEPLYLDDNLLATPALALDRVRMELAHVGEHAHAMLCDSLGVVLDGDRRALGALATRDDPVDALHGAIVSYLGRLSREPLAEKEAALLSDYLTAANHIENIGDMVETNVVSAGIARLEAGVEPTQATRDVIGALHARVCDAVASTLRALEANDAAEAADVVGAKPEIDALVAGAERHLARRLGADERDRLAHFRIETELIEYLRRVYYFAKRIAKQIVVREAPEADA